MDEDFSPGLAPDGEYYSCTGLQHHREGCKELAEDDPKRLEFGFDRMISENEICLTITKWDVGINIMQRKFAKEGVNPHSIAHPDLLQQDCKLRTIFEIIQRLELMPLEEVDLIYQQMYYQKLQEIFTEIQPAIRKAKEEALKQGTLGRGIEMPPGIR